MVVGALALFTAVTWPGVPFAFAVLTAEQSEQRPALLDDARWDEPNSDAAFRARFHAGVPEAELLTWLKQNRFTINRSGRKAEHRIGGFPCNELAEVHWSVEGTTLRDARATIAEAGCL